jgi:hypothetical protein
MSAKGEGMAEHHPVAVEAEALHGKPLRWMLGILRIPLRQQSSTVRWSNPH